jgi:hypothetical protein
MIALASMVEVEEKDVERALLIIKRKARGYLSEPAIIMLEDMKPCCEPRPRG